MSFPAHFLIAGATGRQGGSVVDALLSHPDVKTRPTQVFAISRRSTGPGAERLRKKYPGINIIAGDLKDSTAIFEQLDKNVLADMAVFLAQSHGPSELPDAKCFIGAAAVRGVNHFVYSSVDRGGREKSDKDPSYCKTFADKFYIEQHLKNVCNATNPGSVGGGRMSYTILRPTWFADNAYWDFPGRLCMTGWRDVMAGKKMQVTVVKDIGRWAAEALLRPDRTGLRSISLSIASDEVDFDEVDRIFQEWTGKGVPVTYGLMARAMIWGVKDLHTMFGFIGKTEYGADMQWLRKQLPPTSFRQWVEETVPKHV